MAAFLLAAAAARQVNTDITARASIAVVTCRLRLGRSGACASQGLRPAIGGWSALLALARPPLLLPLLLLPPMLLLHGRCGC
jgi:hypothetical protein